jgi:mannose-1-phosphate guanylyltransferase
MRLRPLTDDRPKAMIEVYGRPIAEYQLDWLAEANVEKVVFACGYKWERLKEHFGQSYKGMPIEYSVEEEQLGTGGAVKKAISVTGRDESLVVANGDVITDLPLKRMIESYEQAGEITASMLLVPYRSRFGVVRIDKLKMVRDFNEKPAFPDVWINGGVYLLNARRTLKYLPDKGDIERETFPKLVAHGELLSYPYYGEWSFMDSLKDLRELEDRLQSASRS